MNQVPALEKKHLLADCPNCRGNQLYSVRAQKSSLEFFKNDELLVCRTCRLTIYVKELKKMLLCA